MSFLVHIPTYVFDSLPRGPIGRALLAATDELQNWDTHNLNVQAAPDYTFCPVLVSLAAVHCMAVLNMGPDDFAELARGAARLSVQEAAALRRCIKGMGRS